MNKKPLVIILLLLFLLLLALFSFYRHVQRYGDTVLRIQQETLFTLPAGSGQMALAELLSQQQLIMHTGWLPLLLKLEPELSQFKAGTYRLQPGMTLRQLLLLLSSGKEAQFSIRFIEGTRLQEWLQQLAVAPYLKHRLEGKTVEQVVESLHQADSHRNPQFKADYTEGWFYPDTYLYTAGTGDDEILQRAHRQMLSILLPIWEGRDKNLPYQQPVELLIMASIIEKETAIDGERSKVASVFINRLRKGMRLQTDPTVIYGMGEAYQGRISRKDLETATPYNTYTNVGLPPTPIAMPGKASLYAAAHPAETGYLYFVADGQGGHTFSRTLQEHNQAVRNYLSTQRKSTQQQKTSNNGRQSNPSLTTEAAE